MFTVNHEIFEIVITIIITTKKLRLGTHITHVSIVTIVVVIIIFWSKDISFSLSSNKEVVMMMIIVRLLLLVTILSTVYSNLLTKAYILRKVYKRYSSRITSTSTTSTTTNSINDDIKYLVQRNTMSQTQLFSSNDNDNYISNNNNNGDDNVISKYFVPIFISVWAIGYSLLALVETTSSGGLGDMGGILGVGLVLVLFFGLLGITAFESFKDDKRYDN